MQRLAGSSTYPFQSPCHPLHSSLLLLVPWAGAALAHPAGLAFRHGPAWPVLVLRTG